MRKKALFFLQPGCGGAERMTITIAKLLDSNVFDVHFVVVGRRMGEIKDFIPDRYSLTHIKILNIYDFATLRIIRLLRKIQPQIVFSSLMYLNPRVIFAANYVGDCRTIVRFNCAVNRLSKEIRFMTRYTYPKADLIIAQTDSMRNDLINSFALNDDRVITMHNIIDVDTISESLKGCENPLSGVTSPKFVWVARFNEIKQPEVLIRAFASVHEIESKAKLCLVAKIDETNDCYQMVKTLVEQLELTDNVIFTGFQTNPYKWMKYSDCLVLTSRSEASPNVVLESLYIGTPVVVSNCTPDLDSIITDGNGYIVPVGDVKRTAEAMLKAYHLKGAKLNRKYAGAEEINKLFSA